MLFLATALTVYIIYSRPSESLLAQTNASVNFQGKIVRNDSGFEGINVSNGETTCINNSGTDTCGFEVDYFDAASGGNTLGTETFTNIEIGEYGGIFNIALGTGTFTPAQENSFAEIFQDNATVYAQVKFDHDGNASYTELFDRMAVRSSPFALNSKFLEGFSSDDFVKLAVGTAQADSTTSSSIFINKTGASGNILELQKNASTVWTVNNDGFLGIGDSTPASPLTVGSGDKFQVDINGDIIKINNVTYTWPTITAGGNGYVLTSTTAGVLTWEEPSSSAIADDSLDFIKFEDTLDLDAALTLNQGSYAWTQTYTGTSLPGITYTASGAISAGDAAGFYLNVSNAGTTVPASLIVNSGSGDSLRINDDGTTTDTTPFVVTSSGAVGIGVPTPVAAFEVKGFVSGTSASANSSLYDSDGTLRMTTNGRGQTTWYLNHGSGESGLIAYSTPSGEVGITFRDELNSGRSEFMRLDGGGIAIRAHAGSTIPPELFRVQTGGNVGIGDASPASMLTVGNGDLFQVSSTGDIVAIRGITYTWPSAQAGGSGYILSNNGSGTLTWVSPGAASVPDDSLDFIKFEDTLDLDGALTLNQTTYSWAQTFTGSTGPGLTYTASGAVATGDAAGIYLNVSSASTTVPAMLLVNAGSGYALRVNDDGTTTDSTPFVVGSDGKVGVSTTTLNEALNVNGAVYLTQITAPTPTTDRLYNVGGAVYWNGVNLDPTSALPSGTTGQTIRHNGTSWVADSTLYNSGTNIGIGDGSPASLLTVGNGDLFQVDSTGDIVKIQNVTYDWPSSQGGVGTVLQNNGSGVLSWAAAGGVTGTGTNGYNAYWTGATTLGSEQYVSMTRGGTGTTLTASNGGIVYSNATNLAVLAGTATANRVLLSGSSTAPSWSTAVYPATTSINQILYSSAANNITGLATANSSVLVTDSGGVPSFTALTNDIFTQYALLAGRSGGQTLTGGTGTTDDLILKATSGVGASGSDIIVQVGNNGTTEAMRILYNGNVGIGDTTPASMLTVGNTDLFQVNSSGNIVAVRGITYSWPAAQAGGAGYVLTNNGSGTLTWESPGAASISDDSLDYNKFEDTMDLDAALTLNQTTYSWSQTYTGTSAPGLTYTSSGAVSSGNAAALYMNISNASTTVPAMLLVNAGSGYAFRVNDDGTTTDSTPFLIGSDGKVGVNTTTLNEALNINGSVYLAQVTAPSPTTDRLYNVSGALYWNGVDLTAGAGLPSGTTGQTLRHNGTGWIANSTLINDGTNVGIGDSTPDAKLELLSTTEQLRLTYTDNSLDAKFIVNSSGQLRIDSTSYVWIGDTTGAVTATGDDDLYVEGDIETGGNFYPRVNDSQDLGSSSYRWRDLYLGGETIYLGTSSTDDARISYNTTSNILSFDTDTTSNGDIAFFTNDIYIDKSTGNVGIGDTTPTSALTVGSTDQFQVSSTGAVVAATGLVTSGTVQFTSLTGDRLLATNSSGQLVNTLSSANLVNSISDETGSGSLVFANSPTITSPTITTSVSVPLMVGGSAVGSTLSLRSTSGVGTTDAILFQVGNNGATESMRIINNGNVGIGDTTPASPLTVGSGDRFQVNSTGDIIRIDGVTYDWPTSQAGAGGYVLTNNGTGGLTWQSPGSGSITLTGDVTGSGTGSISTTVAANSVALGADTTGNYVTSISNGSGISGGNGGSESAALTLALGALTGHWNQTGAFDVVLDNSASELFILEAGTSPTFYGIFDIADLSSSDRTYTFPNADGTVALGTGTAGYNAYWSAANTLASEQYISLSRGGTGTTMTASNGGIVYSNATSLALLAGTPTANRLLMSGASGAPSWSTATYPATAGTSGTILRSNGTNWVNTTATYPTTTTAYRILYSSAANVIGEITSANSSLLTTNGSGIPSFTAITSDTFTQYALLAGRSGGQTLIGGTGTTEDLVLRATSGVGASGSDLIFQVGNNGATEAMRVLYNGYLGIGDSTPASMFTVGNGDRFQVNNNGDLIRIDNVAYDWPSSQGGVGTVLQNNGSGTLSWVTPTTIPTGSNGQTLRFNGTVLSAASNLYNDGTNIGIGDSSPLSLLTVGTNDAFRIDSSGNIGIGMAPGVRRIIGINRTLADDLSGYASGIDLNITAYTGASMYTQTAFEAEISSTSSYNTGIQGGYISATKSGISSGDVTGLHAGTSISGSNTSSTSGIRSNVWSAQSTGGAIYGIQAIATDVGTYSSGANTLIGGYFSISSYGPTGGNRNSYVNYLDVGNITNNGSHNLYGLYIDNVTGADNNYAIYSAGGQSYFAGNVGIGDSTPDSMLGVRTSTDGDVLSLYDGNGTCEADPETGSMLWICSSDRRLKTDIQEAGSVLTYLINIPLYDYTVISSGERMLGPVAQEMQNAGYEELVRQGDDGYLQVSEVGSWRLVRAIQEQQSAISSMEQKIEILNERIDQIEEDYANSLLGSSVKPQGDLSVSGDLTLNGKMIVGDGTGTLQIDGTIDVDAIISEQIDVRSLSALSIGAGSINAGSINSTTITATNGTIATADITTANIGSLDVSGVLVASESGVEISGPFKLDGILSSSGGVIEVTSKLKGVGGRLEVEGTLAADKLEAPEVDADDINVKRVSVDRSDVAGASAGVGTITAGDLTTLIESTAVESDTLVFVTLKTILPGINISVINQEVGSFEVTLSGVHTEDVEFNWLVVR